MLSERRRNRKSVETCDEFAERWPDDYPIVKHGPTRGQRKSDKTLRGYRDELKPFVREFRGVKLADVDRPMARKFANARPRSAVVVRNMFSDAVDDGLIDANPFANLQLEQARGRSQHPTITEEELHDLADAAVTVLGSAYGQVYRSFILATGYVGCRLNEGLNLEHRDLRPREREVDLRVTKFSKPRTVLLLPEAWGAIETTAPGQARARLDRQAQQATTKGNCASLRTPVRALVGQAERCAPARARRLRLAFVAALHRALLLRRPRLRAGARRVPAWAHRSEPRDPALRQAVRARSTVSNRASRSAGLIHLRMGCPDHPGRVESPARAKATPAGAGRRRVSAASRRIAPSRPVFDPRVVEHDVGSGVVRLVDVAGSSARYGVVRTRQEAQGGSRASPPGPSPWHRRFDAEGHSVAAALVPSPKAPSPTVAERCLLWVNPVAPLEEVDAVGVVVLISVAVEESVGPAARACTGSPSPGAPARFGSCPPGDPSVRSESVSRSSPKRWSRRGPLQVPAWSSLMIPNLQKLV